MLEISTMIHRAQFATSRLWLLCGAATVYSLVTVGAIAAPAEPAVKRSTSGICHDQDSPSYAATKNYTSYDSIEQCLKAGGRLPKNLPRDQPQLSDGSDEQIEPPANLNPKIVVIGLAGIAAACVGGYWVWRRSESGGDDIFKRRPHRWDPWLKRIGYFDKNRKR